MNNRDGENQRVLYTSFPYIAGITPKVIKIFQRFEYIKITNKEFLSSKSLFTKVNCKIPLSLQSNIVYTRSIPSSNFNEEYI